jgi:hypothetical protein
MHKSATKCNETVGKWCKNKHGASKIIDTLETYQRINAIIWNRIFILGTSSQQGLRQNLHRECPGLCFRLFSFSESNTFRDISQFRTSDLGNNSALVLCIIFPENE